MLKLQTILSERGALIRRATSISLLILLFILMFSGCYRQNSQEDAIIRLDKTTSLPESTLESGMTLKVAVSAILSPTGTVKSYQPFLDYMEKQTGKKVILVQRKTYQEINDLIAKSMVDIAFICTGAYFTGADYMDLLVTPRISGKNTYQSLLIVPAVSVAESLLDLKNGSFAFTDPLSNTGYLFPMSLLEKKNLKRESFFRRSVFTHSHDRSIMAVMDGLVDGAAVDSIVYEMFMAREPMLASKTRVIGRSQEFGMPPVVVPLNMDAGKKEYLRSVMLHLDQTDSGKQVLKTMGVDRFLLPDSQLYANNPYL